MDRAVVIRQILEITSILGEDVLLEVIEEQKKTAPGWTPEAVGVEKRQQG